MEFATASAVPGLRAFTSLRGANLGLNTEAPADEVVAARRALWQSLDLKLEATVFMRQVHGDRLIEIGKAQSGRGALSLEDAIPICSLLITRHKGVMLPVGHADCLAVLVADKKRGGVGVAHMGWRG